MKSLFTSLSQTKALWVSFSLTLILTLIFGVVMYIGEFRIIDEMYSSEDIRRHIANMTPEQRSMHAWLTGTVDVIYPFTYGAFFIGIAMKYFGRFGFWLALPTLVLIMADLTEGFSQIMLLTGDERYMGLKTIATPTKLILYISELCVTVIGLVIALKDRFRNQS